MKKTLKLSLAITFLQTLISCSSGGGGGSSPAPTVEGADYSGTYTLAGIECIMTSSPYSITDAGVFSAGAETLVIRGNSFTMNMSSGSCSAVLTGKGVFNTDNTVNITQRVFTSASSGSCLFGYTISNTPANNITPATTTYTAQTGSTLPDITSNWIRNTSTGAMGLLSNFKTTDASDLCFLVYTKQ